MDIFIAILNKFISYSLELIPFFVIAAIIGAGIQAYLDINIIRKYINNRILSPLITTFFAASVPICSCSMIPLAQSLNTLSRYYSPVIAFLVSAPSMSPVIFFLMIGMFGLNLTIYRFIFSILLAVIGAYLVDFLFKKPVSLQLFSAPQKKAISKIEKFKKEFLEILFGTGKYVLIGLLIASVLSVVVPSSLVSQFAKLPFSYLFIAIFSIPLYMASGEEVPIGKSLLELGLTEGQVLTFMLSASGICIPTIMATLKFFPKKLVIYYVLLWFFGSIIAGLSYDLLKVLF